MQSSVSSQPNIAVLIVAAGAGLRAGGGVPKQYRVLGGKPLLTRTLETFARFRGIDDIVPISRMITAKPLPPCPPTFGRE